MELIVKLLHAILIHVSMETVLLMGILLLIVRVVLDILEHYVKQTSMIVSQAHA